jgi:hypothetical protein
MNKPNSQTKLPPGIKDVPSMTKNPMMDMFLTYQFLKRINVPFEKWDAYKLGIIDKNGKVLKKKSTLKSPQEKASWGYFDILTANLKKMLAKIPGGNSTLGSSVASYMLVKEDKSDLLLNEQYFEYHFTRLYAQLTEEGEVPANNIGSGNVKTFDPLLIPKAKNMLRRKKPYVDTKLPS